MLLYRPVACLLLVPLLTSCAVIDAIDAEMEAQRRAQEAAWLAQARSSCEQFGFKAGSDALAQCVQTEVNNIKNRKAIADEAQATRSAMQQEARQTREAIENAAKKK